MTDPVAIKRLRFQYDPSAGESVCGSFAAACHDHRLRSIASGLEGVGIRLTRPGSIQVADPKVLNDLAFAMRTDPALLQPLAFSFTDQRDQITLGELQMPRAAFDWERRRIGPASLLETPYHRNDWLNLLLPYCPSSLELLVDTCPKCGPLGWRYTRGIANCEQCGEVVPASEQSGLDANLAEDYRDCARLMSRDPEAGKIAKGRVPYLLQGYSRTVLVDILIRVGVVCSQGRMAWAVEDLKKQTPDQIARTICLGMEMLRGWPNSIRSHARERSTDMQDDISAYEKLRVALRKVGGKTAEGHEMIMMAFPKIDGRTADTFASDARYYTATQTNTLLWTASCDLVVLRDVKALRYEKLPSIKRLRARYNADDVDVLRAHIKNSFNPGEAAVKIGVPTYAIEQFVQCGQIELLDQAGVVALRGAQVAKDSVERLLSELRTQAQNSKAPKRNIAVRRALGQIPGEKPWGALVKAMLNGAISYYPPTNKISLREFMIDPAHILKLKGPVIKFDASALAITHISLRDACELLAGGYEEGIAAITFKGLEVVRFGAGKGVLRSELNELVSEIAFAGEAAAYTGRNGIGLNRTFQGLGIQRIHGAWSRRELLKRGFVNSIKVPSP